MLARRARDKRRRRPVLVRGGNDGAGGSTAPDAPTAKTGAQWPLSVLVLVSLPLTMVRAMAVGLHSRMEMACLASQTRWDACGWRRTCDV